METSKGLGPLRQVDMSLTVNGQVWQGEVPVEEVLLEFVRDRLGLTGTKRSCESEVCGACTVLVDEMPVSSCTYLAWEAHNKSVTTVEGLASDGQLDALQEAFIQRSALQCGFCTAGMLMASKALLLRNPSPTTAEVTEWMEGNICRCGCYPAIVSAILDAASQGPR